MNQIEYVASSMSTSDDHIRCAFAYDFTHELEDIQEQAIAHGGYSSVYRAKVRGQDVAIKVLRKNITSIEVSDTCLTHLRPSSEGANIR